MKIKEYNQMMSYLTKPNRVFPSKPKQETVKKEKKEIVVPGPLEQLTDKTEKEVMKDPNLLRRIKYAVETYDDIKLGEDFDKAIAQEDKNLATARGKTILQRYPKEATPQQMENLKNNFNKYKETQKPFSQRKKTLKPEPVKPVTVVPDPKLKEIEDGLKALNIIHEPEPTVEEIIKERADKRLELEQKEYDQKFGTGGIAQLRRPL